MFVSPSDQPVPSSAIDASVGASIERIAAFSDGDAGGNPAGVWIGARLPPDDVMQRLAREVGYSETAFAAPLADGEGWRVRYFAPETEVPFCGHATVALGAALARAYGDGVYALRLNRAAITVEGRARQGGAGMQAALQSPPTHSRPADPQLVAQALALFGYAEADLDPRLPPGVRCSRRCATSSRPGGHGWRRTA
jgi:PhzF family phenazine biosynthesis protein